MSWCLAQSGTMTRVCFLLEISFRQLQVCNFVAPFLTRGRVCKLLYNCFWALPEQSLLGKSPAELTALLTKMYWLLGRKSKLSTSNKLLIHKTILKPIWTYGIQLWGYGFHSQHRNSRTFLIESLAHNCGRTLVSSEYGYPKGFPNTRS
jgi:hypothetical protein